MIFSCGLLHDRRICLQFETYQARLNAVLCKSISQVHQDLARYYPNSNGNRIRIKDGTLEEQLQVQSLFAKRLSSLYVPLPLLRCMMKWPQHILGLRVFGQADIEKAHT